ncbi:hypothetical protein BT67DRAFT_53641 [Trichocladium antarcticum]|uniref:Uncharacterized protein n=1 Tax=Trichocladium antarcticum TaxID=1450529 RepID=A0AAN6ZC28_9PEZI|nr:hypothetical protein BT67DRAFT_53641 [Trichocladium antarcticum]
MVGGGWGMGTIVLLPCGRPSPQHRVPDKNRVPGLVGTVSPGLVPLESGGPARADRLLPSWPCPLCTPVSRSQKVETQTDKRDIGCVAIAYPYRFPCLRRHEDSSPAGPRDRLALAGLRSGTRRFYPYYQRLVSDSMLQASDVACCRPLGRRQRCAPGNRVSLSISRWGKAMDFTKPHFAIAKC